jgi:hypothetical protein
VISCVILERIRDGIVVSDPLPQYSALDRMDGLDRACPKVVRREPSHKRLGERPGSNKAG